MNIAVFFGSRSPEHDVSIASAYAVMKGLSRMENYNFYPVYISPAGKWLYNNDFKEIKNFRGKRAEGTGKEVFLSAENGKAKLIFKGGFLKKEIIIDVIFPVFHGANGEDGTFQGLCELLDIPYASSGVLASAIGMDKGAMKDLIKTHNIPSVNYLYFSKDEFLKDKDSLISKIEKELSYPVFVKPAHLGSSIGVSKARSRDDLIQGLEVAAYFDDKIIIEESVENLKEVFCSARRVGGNIEISLTQEPVLRKDFLTFEEKYIEDGGTMAGIKDRVKTPADIPGEIDKKAREITKKIFKILNCGGAPRIDFLYDTKNLKLYFNEINLIPGALQANLWQKSGVEFVDLLKSMIDDALEIHKKKNELNYNFNSKIIDKTIDFKK